MSFFVELVTGIGASAIAASAVSAIVAYINKNKIKNIKVGYKGIDLKGISQKEIDKILNEILEVKKNPQVFIMYSHDEKELARKITDDLSKDNIRVWLDEQNLRIGDSITESVNKALNESQWILFIPPKKNNLNNGWVSKEIDMALASEKWRSRHFVIPIKTKDGHLPDTLKDRLWVDFSANYEEAIEKLKSGILRSKEKNIDSLYVNTAE